MSKGTAVLRARSEGDGVTALLSPGVGVFTPSVAEGDLVGALQPIGTLEALGVEQPLLVPDGTAGRVSGRTGGSRTRVPVQFGEVLVSISTAAVAVTAGGEVSSEVSSTGALSFDAPMSGRFYSRPSPNEEPFVADGDTVTTGQTIGLLEVMKTFNRLVYEGESLPAQATVERIVPADGDDVVRGDPILLLGGDDGE